jgi:hypothetical protein
LKEVHSALSLVTPNAVRSLLFLIEEGKALLELHPKTNLCLFGESSKGVF